MSFLFFSFLYYIIFYLYYADVCNLGRIMTRTVYGKH